MVRTCRVSITDLENVTHTVEVTAETLYEAVALGLAAMKNSEWVAQIAHGLNTATVRVMDVSAEHTVMFHDFNKWLESPTCSFQDMARRERVREILGLTEKQS
jgi:phosphoribosylformimino-5-aminoimidazole carboxamide ribonucleotide (ProFAR) isomerase